MLQLWSTLAKSEVGKRHKNPVKLFSNLSPELSHLCRPFFLLFHCYSIQIHAISTSVGIALWDRVRIVYHPEKSNSIRTCDVSFLGAERATYQEHDCYLFCILCFIVSVQWVELHSEHDSKVCVTECPASVR